MNRCRHNGSPSRGHTGVAISLYWAAICILSIILVPTICSAIVYCPLDASSSPTEGYPLPVAETQTRDTNKNGAILSDYYRGYYQCPSKTHCCPKSQCCPIKFKDDHLNSEADSNFFDSSMSLSSILGFIVAATCLTLSVLILVCCFWTPCPLSNACPIRYTRDNAGCADKMGQVPDYLDAMPSENVPLGNTFLINHFFQRKDGDLLQGQEVAV
ncbi:hypothetical protein HDE_03424 [Halotydeus destructor]|nr:hypothetical protein HDE_03424 [Halotydeus destructor]